MSLDLNGLAKSLPASNFEKAEKELLNNFKAAALSITTLYRSSRHASKRAYNAGYAAACHDLIQLIQQGNSSNDTARILNWIQARMDAVKSREEEEDEDEEREKDKDHPQQKDTDHTPRPMPLTPHSPTLTVPAPPARTSPSPPAPRPQIPANRLPKSRVRKDIDPTSPTPLSSSENIFRTPQVNTAPSHSDTDFSAGAKRRHAVMMMLDSTPSAVSTTDVLPSSSTPSVVLSGTANTRRRTRSQRSTGHVQAQLHATTDAVMDIEEDGRERKRVTRR